jgi:hypothetical protein
MTRKRVKPSSPIDKEINGTRRQRIKPFAFSYEVDGLIRDDDEELKPKLPAKRRTKRDKAMIEFEPSATSSDYEDEVEFKPHSATTVGSHENGVYGPSDDHLLIENPSASDKKQTSCCLLDCDRSVTNRLRFSLRLNHWFKRDFLEKRWDKVCEYHYFNDRYLHKKQIDDSAASKVIEKKSPKKRQQEPTLKKNKPRKQPKRESKKRRISEMLSLEDEQEQIAAQEAEEEETRVEEEEEIEEHFVFTNQVQVITTLEEEEDFVDLQVEPDSSLDEVSYSTPPPQVITSPESSPSRVVYIQTEYESTGIELFFGEGHIAAQQSSEILHDCGRFIQSSNVAQSPISRLDHNPFDTRGNGPEKYHQLQRMVERLTVYRPPIQQQQHVQWDFIPQQHFVPSQEFANELL